MINKECGKTLVVRLRDYLYYFSRIPELCDELKRDTLESFFKRQPPIGRAYYAPAILYSEVFYWFPYSPQYRQKFEPIKRAIEICDVLGIKDLEANKSLLTDWVRMLETPETASKQDMFILSIDNTKKVFDNVKEEIRAKISLLNDTEIERLNEAIHTYFEECYCSTVAMSVCAIEFRLLSLMKTVKPDKEEELNQLTLGQLIGEYLRNKSDYKNIVPQRHESLLNLCNRYRISAVHPKGEEITKRVSSSILNFSFEFLLDEALKVT